MSVGASLREARNRAGLSLRDLAKRAGISISKLSKVENSISTLRHPELIKVAEALTIPAASLLDTQGLHDRQAGCRLLTPADGGPKFDRGGRQYEVLCGGMSGKSPLYWRVTIREKVPGTDISFVSHPGQEFVYVLNGKVVLCTDSYSPLELSAGDSILFDAETSHAYFALTRRAVILMANARPVGS
jgi:transcriptional regulator with XRE-family HTH domain